ncbi:MAG: pyruvate kinase [Clostridia bacterium]|nr:pyruvate kinase [Clostridia bacterium]
MRKTKIICAPRPDTADEKTLRKLMLSGMNVARFNFFTVLTQATNLPLYGRKTKRWAVSAQKQQRYLICCFFFLKVKRALIKYRFGPAFAGQRQ